MKKCLCNLKMPYRAFLFLLILLSLILSPLKIFADSSVNTESLNFILGFQDQNSGGLKDEYVDDPQSLETDWGIVAFSASGYDPNSVGTPKSLIDFALSDVCSLSALTDIERRTISLNSAKINTHNLVDCNLPEKIISTTDPTGQIGDGLVSTVFGVLALESSGDNIDQATIDYIISSQNADGGWDSGYGTESNFTSQTIMALAGSGRTIPQTTTDNVKLYLKNLQIDTGGIKYDGSEWSTESDAFSDSYTLQAIYALGESPSNQYWLQDGKSILDDLGNLKNDDGSYNFNQSYGKMNPVWTTSIALIGLNRKFLPINVGTLGNWADLIPAPTPTPTPTPTPILAPDPTPNTYQQESSQSTISTPKTNSPKVVVSSSMQTESSSANSENSSPGVSSPIQTVSNKQESASVKGASVSALETLRSGWYWLVLGMVLAFFTGAFVKFIEIKYVNKKYF